MTNLTRREVMGRAGYFVLAGLGGAGAAVLWGREAGSADRSSREQMRDKHFPNVELVTHQGKTVRFYDDLMKNKIVVINFMYTRCADGTCPITSANLAQVQKLIGKERLGRDIFFYSITLTPEVDTPAVLAKYARAYEAGPGWLFLTGKAATVELLRKKLGFSDPDPKLDADKASHIGNIRYGNEALQLWAACPGNSNPEYIATQIMWVDWPKPDRSATASTAHA